MTLIEMLRLETDRADTMHVLHDLGMIEPIVEREDRPVRWVITPKGQRALEDACDRERAL